MLIERLFAPLPNLLPSGERAFFNTLRDVQDAGYVYKDICSDQRSDRLKGDMEKRRPSHQEHEEVMELIGKTEGLYNDEYTP